MVADNLTTAPKDVILAATFRQAHLTADIDWHWNRISADEYEMPDGRRARIATRSDQLRGLPYGTILHFAYDAHALPWRDWQMVEIMLASGNMVAGRRR